MPFLSQFVHSVIKAREPAIEEKSQGGTRLQKNNPFLKKRKENDLDLLLAADERDLSLTPDQVTLRLT
jgi:hypothetical protein